MGVCRDDARQEIAAPRYRVTFDHLRKVFYAFREARNGLCGCPVSQTLTNTVGPIPTFDAFDICLFGCYSINMT